MITIEFYAQLRDEAKENHITHDFQGPAIELWEMMRKRFSFSLDRQSLSLAINDEFVNWQSNIVDGDKVVFIPPVAGG